MGCQVNCLHFYVEFMRSSTKADFLLVFSDANVNMQIPLKDNLVVSINGMGPL